MTLHDPRALAQLLDDTLPALLRSLGCQEAAVDLDEVRLHRRARSQLLSALQEASDATLEFSARAEEREAIIAEQVAVLAMHLQRCIELSNSRYGRLHLRRALELGRQLRGALDSRAS